MKICLVGGAVRDRLLGLPVNERDWAVEGATDDEMLAVGFRRADADFPVFLHPDTKEEYALARTEQKTGPGYKGFVVNAESSVTLEQDLARRDLTINAMAEDEQGQLIDPFNGLGDLKQQVLRHITPAFEEDPVRVLRVARFAARFGSLGFEIAPETKVLMRKMSDSGDLRTIKPERLWQEMSKALETDQPWQFFAVLHDCGALAVLIPELDATIKTASSLSHLQNATEQGGNRAVRFAVLMYGVVAEGESLFDLCNKLRVERDCMDLLGLLVQLGPDFASAGSAGAEGLHGLLVAAKALQQPERFRNFIMACTAIWPVEAAITAQRLNHALEAMQGIDPKELLAEGLQGREIGDELARRRVKAIEARLDS